MRETNSRLTAAHVYKLTQAVDMHRDLIQKAGDYPQGLEALRRVFAEFPFSLENYMTACKTLGIRPDFNGKAVGQSNRTLILEVEKRVRSCEAQVTDLHAAQRGLAGEHETYAQLLAEADTERQKGFDSLLRHFQALAQKLDAQAADLAKLRGALAFLYRHAKVTPPPESGLVVTVNGR